MRPALVETRQTAAGRGNGALRTHGQPQIVLNVGCFPTRCDCSRPAPTGGRELRCAVRCAYTGERICGRQWRNLSSEEVVLFTGRSQLSATARQEVRRTPRSNGQVGPACGLGPPPRALPRPAWPAGFGRGHARGILPLTTARHFVVSFTLRACCTFSDLARQARCQRKFAALRPIWPPFSKTWAAGICRLVREKRACTSPPSPLDSGWLSKQCRGGSRVHIRARVPLGLVLISCPGDLL